MGRIPPAPPLPPPDQDFSGRPLFRRSAASEPRKRRVEAATMDLVAAVMAGLLLGLVIGSMLCT